MADVHRLLWLIALLLVPVLLAAACETSDELHPAREQAREEAKVTDPKVESLHMEGLPVPDGFRMTEAEHIDRYQAGAGFVDGFTVFFDKEAASISVRADIYETEGQVQAVMTQALRGMEIAIESGMQGLEAVPIEGESIGEEAVAVRDENITSYYVVFRRDNVFGYAGVSAGGSIAPFEEIVLALARELDSRIAASLATN